VKNEKTSTHWLVGSTRSGSSGSCAWIRTEMNPKSASRAVQATTLRSTQFLGRYKPTFNLRLEAALGNFGERNDNKYEANDL